MLFKNKNSSNIDDEQIALIEYAQQRIKSKKRLFFHFFFMAFVLLSAVIANLVFDVKKEYIFFELDWSYWLCITWLIVFFTHTFNVFITNRFMGKEWEKKQMKVLVNKQQVKIAEIKAELEKEARIIAESQLYSKKIRRVW